MVTEKEIAVYGKLFDIAAGNMEAAGKKMEIDRDAFLAVVHMNPHKADISRMAHLSKRGMVQALFASMCHRYPDDGAFAVWRDREGLDDFEYRKILTKSLRNAKETKVKQVSQVKNPYFDGETEEIRTMVVTGYGRLDRLFEIYSKMPHWMQRLAKKIMR